MPPRLVRVEVAGEALLVYVMDGADVREVVAAAVSEMIRDRVIPMTVTRVATPAEVPADRHDSIPWSLAHLNEEQHTIRDMVGLRRVAFD